MPDDDELAEAGENQEQVDGAGTGEDEDKEGAEIEE
jgi:hypothetical protein